MTAPLAARFDAWLKRFGCSKATGALLFEVRAELRRLWRLRPWCQICGVNLNGLYCDTCRDILASAASPTAPATSPDAVADRVAPNGGGSGQTLWRCLHCPQVVIGAKPTWTASFEHRHEWALSAPAPPQEPTWREKFEKAVCVIVPLGCERQPQLSRICERGTPCCGIHHGKAAALAPPQDDNIRRIADHILHDHMPADAFTDAAERLAHHVLRAAAPAPPALEQLRKAVARYDANDSETSYYDAKDVCDAARTLLADVARLQTPPLMKLARQAADYNHHKHFEMHYSGDDHNPHYADCQHPDCALVRLAPASPKDA